MLRKIIKFAVLLGFVKPFFASEIMTYNDLKSAIKNGNEINIVVNLTRCKSDGADKDHGRTLRFKPDNFTYTAKDHLITSSYRNFNIFHPEHLGIQIYEYYHLHVLENNTLVIGETHLSAKTNKQLSSSVRFACQLGDSARIFVNSNFS